MSCGNHWTRSRLSRARLRERVLSPWTCATAWDASVGRPDCHQARLTVSTRRNDAGRLSVEKILGTHERRRTLQCVSAGVPVVGSVVGDDVAGSVEGGVDGGAGAVDDGLDAA